MSFLQTVLWMSLNLPSSKLREKLQRVETKQCISENYIQQDQDYSGHPVEYIINNGKRCMLNPVTLKLFPGEL